MGRTADMVHLWTGPMGIVHVRGIFATPRERHETTCGLQVPRYVYQRQGSADLISCLDCTLEMIARRAYWHDRFAEKHGETPTEYGNRRIAELDAKPLGGFYGRKRVR